MPEIATRTSGPTPIKDTVALPPKLPQLPEEVFNRFPSLRDWQDKEDKWWNRAYVALQSMNSEVSDNLTSNKNDTKNLRISFNEFSAAITEEVEVIADELGAQAKRIITVSAMAGVSQNIKVQTTEPVGPALNDYWIDTSVLTLPITYQWNGVDWVEVTTPISAAAVSDERTARVTADGYLEGKYTLTVVAGTVITGFNITSASGAGTNVSNVAWTADQFQIYSGTANLVMFYADGVQNKVRLSNVLTIDGAGASVYIKTTAGAGSYNSAGTPWFVDSTGRMSLGTGLTFDGSNLSISGTVTAAAGSIGGWTISSTTLSRNNAVLDSAGQLVLGTTNDVVYLSATDATYRIWIGNATAGSATFRVTKAGAVTATSGTIGGWTLASTTFSANNAILDSAGQLVLGTSNDVIYLSATDATYRIWAGNVTAGSATFSVTKAGAIYSVSGTIGGFTLSTTSFTSGSGATYVEIQNSGSPFIKFGAGSNYVALYSQTGLAFTGSTGIGSLGGFFGTSGGANLLYVCNNSSVATLNFSGTTGILSIGTQVLSAAGSASTPSYGMTGATNTGMFLSGSDLAFCTGGTMRGFFDTSYNFGMTNGTVTNVFAIDTGTSRGTIGTTTNHILQVVTNGAVVWFFGSDGHFKSNGGDIRKVSSDAWTVKLYDGASNIEFQASGGQIYGRINGGAAILLG